MNDMEDLALQGARSLDDQEDIAYLEAELSKAKEQVSASAAEFGRKREALVEEVDARETRIRHLQDEAIDLKRQLTQAADDKKKSEEEVKVVSSILASVEVDQESLQLKIEQANNKAAEDARAASEEVHAAALRERALQVQMQTLRAELAEAVDRCPSPPSSPKSDPVKAQLEVDLSRLQQEIDTLMERIHLVEVTNKSLCDRLGAAEAEIEEATQTEWTLLAALGVRCQELGALCLSHQALLKSSDANDRERAALHETVHCLTESFGALQALLSLSQGTAVQTWRYISALREQRDTQSESEMEFWRALTTTIDMGEPMECFPQKPSADWAWLSLAQSATSYVYDISARLALSEQAADVLRRDHDEIRRTAADLATTCATLEERLMVAASEGACSALLEKRTRSTGTWTGALTAGREGYLKSHVIRLESDRAAVSSEKAQVESELLEMRAQYSRAQEALSGLGTQLAHATTQLNQRDRELSALRQRLDESDVGAALLRDNADSTQAKSAVLQAQLQEREKENLELQALLEERSGLLRKAACELKCGPAKKRPSVFPKRKRRLSVVDIDADDCKQI
ncbi:MAG: uncharacterized protein KVP18_003175 [Porospora cf. gigantea A]|uniref:uncharacterized protein n=1 Tax=Porospora cf. gigantea A TaxID=2853593 RepID=UPI00355A5361|nr:MAG: hypothetical protein KVP18_003175 [Porospora cf. gigantea A]